ncbi:MAG: hypothetical protein QOD00_2884 [Blastocatellia bacterium]|nr:hypothetical protein [Blastocatellia bacterium]
MNLFKSESQPNNSFKNPPHKIRKALPMPTHRVLCVEDDADTRVLLKKMLGSSGFFPATPTRPTSRRMLHTFNKMMDQYYEQSTVRVCDEAV